MDWVTAVAVGVFFGPLGVPFKHYLCWFSWAKSGAVLGTLVYLAVAGAGGAFVGYLSLSVLDSAPSSAGPGGSWLDGVGFGLAGVVILRADFRFSESRTGGGRAERTELAHARSLIGAALVWIATALDAWVRLVVERHLRRLDDGSLLDKARETSARITSLAIPAEAKEEMQKLLVPSMEQMRHTEEEPRLQAREGVVQFIADYTVTQHQPR